ncbi:MAG TPA: YdeI/OmpD-associated family protein [Patescibacteria group bacterium]|nr:YdeI/OmpD-associated family protein [Patescibacteria group bacterium]
MPRKIPSPGILHELPDDLRRMLQADAGALNGWEETTPIARNEWICWVSSAKKDDTRAKRISRAREDLAKGKRRPCCWPGCPHR